MNRRRLLFPEEIRELLTRRFNNQHRNWLRHEGQWPLVLGLGSPTERDVTEDVAGFRSWAAAWSAWHDIGEVSWEDRQWARLGRQRIPTSLRLASSDEVARVIGQQMRWTLACERYGFLTTQWPRLNGNSVLPKHFDVLAEYSGTDFEGLCSLMLWLERNPKSDLYLRQLPIEGLDTKWIERRKSLATELICAIRGESEECDFFIACGLRRPRHRIRVRLLCPTLRKVVGFLEDIEAPLEEIAALPLAPAGAVIVENLETGLSLPDLPGVVALMKLGVGVGVLNTVPWLQGIDAVYWGDIDTHGYAILNHARRALPHLRSVLMDKETLFSYRNLWVEEPEQDDSTQLPLLKDHERTVYEGLRSDAWGRKIRLEQERIPWACAIEALKKELLRTYSGSSSNR
jgi:hypothetical protein